MKTSSTLLSYFFKSLRILLAIFGALIILLIAYMVYQHKFAPSGCAREFYPFDCAGIPGIEDEFNKLSIKVDKYCDSNKSCPNSLDLFGWNRSSQRKNMYSKSAPGGYYNFSYDKNSEKEFTLEFEYMLGLDSHKHLIKRSAQGILTHTKHNE